MFLIDGKLGKVFSLGNALTITGKNNSKKAGYMKKRGFRRGVRIADIEQLFVIENLNKVHSFKLI